MHPIRSMLALPLALSLCLGTPLRAAPAATAGSTALAPDLPWAQDRDASPAFTPDGRLVAFARGHGLTRRIYLSQRRGRTWSPPQLAPFSGRWMDMEPAMAPDGSYLVFVSDRPATPGGKVLDGYFGGKPQPGRGGNLWRVDRRGDGWGTPTRLPDIVNTGSSTFSPAVAADGSVYFMKPDARSGHFRLYLSRFRDGAFSTPQPLPFSDGVASDGDPTVSPDQSILVFCSDRGTTPQGQDELFAVFATPAGWGRPIHLGPAGDEARFGPGQSTLYFTAPDNRIHQLPFADWLARHAMDKP